jgi:hypothetical protein
MEQKLGLERLFSLGQYRNIKFIDEITNIPKELMLNDDVINTLRLLQFIRADKYFMSYVKNAQRAYYKFRDGEIALEEALLIADDLENTTTNSLKEIITK